MKKLVVLALSSLLIVAFVLVELSSDERSPSPQPRPSMAAQDFGDDAHLDHLWVVCSAGNDAACEELFDLAPPLSEYARFAIENGASR